MMRQEKLRPLIDRVVEDGSEEQISALRGYLEWMVRQLDDQKEKTGGNVCNSALVAASIGKYAGRQDRE